MHGVLQRQQAPFKVFNVNVVQGRTKLSTRRQQYTSHVIISSLPWSEHFVKKFLYEFCGLLVNLNGSLKECVTMRAESRLPNLARPEADIIFLSAFMKCLRNCIYKQTLHWPGLNFGTLTDAFPESLIFWSSYCQQWIRSILT